MEHAQVHTCNAMGCGSKPQVLHSACNSTHLLPFWHNLLGQSLPPHADCDHVGNLQTELRSYCNRDASVQLSLHPRLTSHYAVL